MCNALFRVRLFSCLFHHFNYFVHWNNKLNKIHLTFPKIISLPAMECDLLTLFHHPLKYRMKFKYWIYWDNINVDGWASVKRARIIECWKLEVCTNWWHVFNTVKTIENVSKLINPHAENGSRCCCTAYNIVWRAYTEHGKHEEASWVVMVTKSLYHENGTNPPKWYALWIRRRWFERALLHIVCSW